MRLVLSIVCGLGAAACTFSLQPASASPAIMLAQAESEGGSIGGDMAPAPGGADWTPYFNDRFGFSVDVPRAFKPLPPPDNNDGATFVSKDQSAEIRAYGYYLQSKSLIYEERTIEKMNADIEVTYRQASPNAFTMSGVTGDQIVYIRAVKTCKGEAVALLRVEYPQSVKAQFDPLIAHMAKTLRGSNACL